MAIPISDVSSRGGLNPNESRLFFKSTGLDETAFQVRTMEGEEAVSRPFVFRLELLADDANIQTADVVGKKATLMIRDREIHGVVTEFSYKGSTTDEHDYSAVLRPRLWTRSLRRDSEVFLDVAPRDVIQAALGGLDFQMEWSESVPIKEYIVQYNETDLDFLSRTAEHWGLSYRFDHAGGSDLVSFFSDSTGAPDVKEGKLAFVAEQSLRGERAAASSFVEQEVLVPGRVLVKDYNYRDPETALLSEDTRRSDDFDSLYYEYGTHHGEQSEGDLLAKVRSEEIECRRRVFTGVSNRHDLAPGFIFELQEHKRDAFNGRYFITSVTHRGSQAFSGRTPEAETGAEYENTFTCIPASVPFRPPRITRIPFIPGVMTAKIESSGGDYAHVDDDGRYRARMHFDLGERGQAEASAPIRMNQPYSGPGYGMHFPNHANTEIVWACINGDPNRPIAIGTAPNPSNASPVTSSNRAQNVIRTQGDNMIVLDDTRGSQDFRIGASHNHTIEVANDQSTQIHGDRTERVDGDHAESIGGDSTIRITGDLKWTVDGDETGTVAGDSKMTVGGDRKISVGGDGQASIGGSAKLMVSGAVQVVLGSSVKLSVGGSLNARIAGAEVVRSSGLKYTSSGQVKIVGGNSIKLQCGASSIVLKKDGTIDIKGVNVTVEGKAKTEVKGTGMLDIKSSGITTVQGSLVKIN